MQPVMRLPTQFSEALLHHSRKEVFIELHKQPQSNHSIY